ncbi:MAG: hypothetical protein Ct9H300mP15_25730 [Gemmatimonadota bacterium]|nr:MAG: hypothetical protein Ct9H300mP15_25730 [Gemmatimonadota bacterium]
MAITKYIPRRPIRSGGEISKQCRTACHSFSTQCPFRRTQLVGVWGPQVDVIETGDELTLTAELPGLSENDVTINLENSVLSISGEKAAIRNEDETEQRVMCGSEGMVHLSVRSPYHEPLALRISTPFLRMVS